MKPSDQSRYDALLQWSRQHGAELHPSLEIYHDEVTKYSLRVKPSASDALQPGFTAVTCPASTTLSYLNALVDRPLNFTDERSVPDPHDAAFPAVFMQTVPPHVIGRFFLVKQYLLGRSSFWAPYIATLPQPEHVHAWALPAFWPDDDIAFLAGTNAEVAIDEIQANVRREFKQARRALKDAGFPGWQDYTSMLYKWAVCIVTSRSFRPSLVLPASSPHVSALLRSSGGGCQLDDFSVLQPLFDIANHSPTARYAWDNSSVDSHNGVPGCRLVCLDAYRPGEQVFNNYGSKTNSELLLGYGFVLPETDDFHNDYVHVRKRQQQQQQEEEEEEESNHDDDDNSSGARGEMDSNTPKPTDFLISLRPFTHPSSLAARARLASSSSAHTFPSPSPLSSLPQFAHFEPALVDDLASALAASTAITPGGTEEEEDEEEAANAAQNLDDRVKATLVGKLRWDYQRLRAVEDGVMAEDVGRCGDEEDEEEDDGGVQGLPPPGNRNQALAVEYREGCKRVLVAALGGLGEKVEG